MYRGNSRGRRGTRYARGSKAWGICDRCGQRDFLHNLKKEPGTGLLVDSACYDGSYNIVDHPQNHPDTRPETMGLKDPRPEVRAVEGSFLEDDQGELLVTDDGQEIIVY